MCDGKYMDVKEGILRYKQFLSDKMSAADIEIVEKIITTMSYSKVKVNGFPELGEYQLIYHIVREADLLAAYDVDRCLIYQMMHEKFDYSESLNLVYELFEKRVLKYRDDKLFITNYAKSKSYDLHMKAIEDIKEMKKINLES